MDKFVLSDKRIRAVLSKVFGDDLWTENERISSVCFKETRQENAIPFLYENPHEDTGSFSTIGAREVNQKKRDSVRIATP